MGDINWNKIRNYYINHNISQQKLAKKFGVSYSTIAHKSVDEKWSALKKEQHRKIAEKSAEKSLEKISDYEAEITQLKKDIRNEIFHQIMTRMGKADLDEQDFRRLVQSYSDMINIEPEQAERQSDAFEELLKTIGASDEA